MAQYQLGAPHSDGETFFFLHLYLAEMCCKSAKGSVQFKSGPSNNMTEQVIEFDLTGPGPLSRSCAPTNGYFYYNKTKFSKANL